jgi:hypothetical protein
MSTGPRRNELNEISAHRTATVESNTIPIGDPSTPLGRLAQADSCQHSPLTQRRATRRSTDRRPKQLDADVDGG